MLNKIFYFPSFYPYHKHGQQWRGSFAHKQCKALSELGCEVVVVNPVDWYPMWPFYLLNKDWKLAFKNRRPRNRYHDQLPVFHPRVFTPKPHILFKTDYNKAYLKTCLKCLKRIGYDSTRDVLFAQWLPEARLVVELGHMLGIKVVVLGIGDDITQIPQESTSKMESLHYTWTKANIRGCVADYLGKMANSLLNLNLSYQVYYSSVDEKLFHPVTKTEKINLRRKLGWNRDEMIILSVGSPIIRKGWLELFDALEILKNENITFKLVGINAGYQELNLDEEVEKRGLTNSWSNIFDCPPSEIHNFYKASDIFCLPSHWEGLANAVIEGMAVGLPVVTSNVNGHPEVINHGVNGFLVEPKNTLEITKQLRNLIQDQELRTMIGKKAANDCLQKPGTHSLTAKKILKDIQDILDMGIQERTSTLIREK